MKGTDFSENITVWGTPRGKKTANENEKPASEEEKIDIAKEKVDIKGKKVDISTEKVDFKHKKVDIGKKLKGHGNTKPTIDKACRMFDVFGFEIVFGRGDIISVVGGGTAGATKLLKILLDADIIEQVSGYGKGKYRFRTGDDML